MTTDEHRLSRKTLNVIAASVIVSAVLLGLLYTVGTHRCLEKTLGFGQETMVFLENACEKYDRYEQGRKTEATHDLLAAVESLAIWLPTTTSMVAIRSCCGEMSWPVRRSHRCIKVPK